MNENRTNLWDLQETDPWLDGSYVSIADFTFAYYNNNDALLFSGIQVGGLPISKHGDCPMIHKMNLRKDPKLQRLEMGSGM